MGLSFIPLGVGDAFSARHYSACLAVEAEGRWLLVDCPHPIRKILREGSGDADVPLDAGSFEAVVLTHLHADHASGLEGLGYYARLVQGTRPRLIADPWVLERLWAGRRAAELDGAAGDGTPAPLPLEGCFDPAPLDLSGEVQAGPFALSARRTRHPVPTTALRIRAGGRTLALSADTPFDPELIEWLAGADLVLHEAGPGIHTPYERLAALPGPLRARLRLFHFPDDLDLAGGAIEPLVQGRRYAV